jgi:hypothetical protein
MCGGFASAFAGPLGIVLDPGGYIAEKANTAIAPKSLKPMISTLSGARGTAKAWQEMDAPLETPAPAQPTKITAAPLAEASDKYSLF